MTATNAPDDGTDPDRPKRSRILRRALGMLPTLLIQVLVALLRPDS